MITVQVFTFPSGAVAISRGESYWPACNTDFSELMLSACNMAPIILFDIQGKPDTNFYILHHGVKLHV
jgi:hypothetical protein